MKAGIKNMAARWWKATLLSFLFSARLIGQQASTDQVLTLQVLEINKIGINNTAVTLIIDQASLEDGKAIPAVNEEGVLMWITNGENKKITVASNNPSPRFLIKLVALDVPNSAGVAGPEVVLSDNTTKDMVIGVSKTIGRCKVKFTASAKIGDGVGSETYIITYTITGS
ncbi:MAG: hypothetical protein AAB393_19215 [Bacteroidota bacterium]